jgi:hypothetical protein
MEAGTHKIERKIGRRFAVAAVVITARKEPRLGI